MTRSHRLTGAALTLLSGIALYGFFALKYPYHLHFQEQYQLFEGTWDYFRTVAAVPGGFADCSDGSSRSSATMPPRARPSWRCFCAPCNCLPGPCAGAGRWLSMP